MSRNQGKSEASLATLYARLDTVHMSAHERLRAKARLAQADAIASVIVDAAVGMKRVMKKLVIRPIRRIAASAG